MKKKPIAKPKYELVRDEPVFVWKIPQGSWGIAREWLGLEEFTYEEFLSQAELGIKVMEQHGKLAGVSEASASDILKVIEACHREVSKDMIDYAISVIESSRQI